MRRWLPEFSVGRPVTVMIGFIALCVLGTIALSRIPLQMLPSGFTPPYVWIWVPYDVSSPLEAQEKVVRPLEDQLATVSGVDVMETWASEDYARVVLAFEGSTEMDDAYNEVVDRLERVRGDLPASVERIGIFRYNPADDPIFWIGLSVDESVSSAHALATDVVQRRLQRMPGVAKVEIWGISPERVFVDFDRERLAAHGVDLGQVIQRMSSDNFQLSGGRVEESGRLQFVRSMARYDGLEDLKQVPVAPGVRLEHVAEVSIHVENDGSIQHINGQPGVGFGVYKASGANTVGLARQVRAEMQEIENDPRMKGSRLYAFWDQGKVIEESLTNLKDTAFQGGLFAVLVLFLFLREWRMTLLVAGVIPVALLLTVTALYFTGRSLNLLSLMGLMVAVGMVVDNAIVVVETIWHRRRDGLDPTRAAVEGTAEVSMAILLSTMTTLVVFLPIILLSDDAMFSFFMGAMGFPVCFALLASLVVALVFSPLSTVVFHRDRPEVASRWMDWVSSWYARALRALLSHRTDAGIGVIVLVVVTVLIPAQAVSCSDVSGELIGDFSIGFDVPESFTLGESMSVIEELEQLVEDHREAWGVSVHRARFSAQRSHGWMSVHLEEELPPEDREAMLDEVNSLLPRRAGVEVWTEREFGGDMGGNSLEIQIDGDSSEVILDLSKEVIRRLKSLPEVLGANHDIEDSGSPEIRLILDRQTIEERGLSARWVGPTIAFAMQGTSLPDLRDDGRELDVRARFEAEDRHSVEALLDFPLWSPGANASIPLRSVVDTEMAKGFSGISRVNRQTSLPIQIELAPGVESEQGFAAIGAALSGLEFPPGYQWSRERYDRDQAENDSSQQNAMILSVVLVFLLMGVLFESFLLPLSIIFTVPMAFVGVAWTLWLTGDSMDTMAGVGLVVLIGVVVNNGIVLIDKVTQLRREGLGRTDALLGAGRRRLRPILMTALTTVVGLLPMALGTRAVLGVPYAPLGRVVAGGLLAGTLLTLFFLPFVYDLLDEMRERSRGFWSRNLSTAEA